MGLDLYRIWLGTARKRQAGQTAVWTESSDSPTSFEDLYQRCEANRKEKRFAKWNGRVVAIQMRNSAQWIEAFLTCQAVGAIPMPVENDLPDEALKRILSFVRPCAVWQEVSVTERPTSLQRKPACLVKLTSGSTGLPNPIFFTDDQMIADGRQIISTMGIRGEDRNLAVIPFGHSYGLGNLIMPLILQGTSLAIAGTPFPHAVSTVAKASGATVFPAVPPLLNGLVRAEVPVGDLNTLRLIISAGSPISPSNAQAFRERFGKRVHNFYGASETGGIAFDRTGEDTLTGEAAGTPLDGVILRRSASGRLLVSSEAVFTRYNRRRLGRNGACLLPDLTELRSDGSVILKGRTARQIKLGGKRLALAEVEQEFKRIAGVHEVFVSGYQDQQGGTRLGAVLLHENPLEAIKDAIRDRLPAWKRPSRWQSVKEWPVTARGKPDFKRLKQLIESRPAGRAEQ